MRMIVQSFMEQHPHDPRADDFSQKEAAIVSVLHGSLNISDELIDLHPPLQSARDGRASHTAECPSMVGR